MSKLFKKLAVAALGMTAASAFAATGDTTFQTIFDTLNGWATGTLGKVIAISMFIVGLAAGIVRQSIMAVVAGVAAAITMAYGPGIIDGMFTATV
jgi:conjugal transfer pilus assembly protein TraA